MTPLQYTFAALVFPAALFAQHLSHPVAGSREDAVSTPRQHLLRADTVRVLAVMVQFRTDNDAGTTGNGTFDLSTPSSPAIDAPPHAAAYFQAHLEFLSSYFRRASGGEENVVATLVDTVYTLPQQLADYSPRKGETNLRLANLARDTWSEVDSSGRVGDFSRYDCFVIFHAGAGHDIDLTALLGSDPTPRDIPSLFLGPGAFRSLYGQSYRGIPVNGGAFFITNTAILPETESRLLPGATGDVPLDLGINGLMCASIGSFLGLPDLFDTRSGATGIGRFGLMDGQSIFSFSGVFPPLPSAWERYWLGWVDPITVPPGETAIRLPAVSVADTVYRVPVSGQEYFLVENRNRDPERNGAILTTWYNGATRVQVFTKDTTGFNAVDVSQLSGVVTDIDDPDWSLPGGVAPDGTLYDGGVLIWQINDHVIAQSIAADAVNADSSHRGVDLEEADGPQDIGQTYDQLSPRSGTEDGTPFDFWFQGNPSPVYKNEFSGATLPSSRSTSGADSHVTIKAFSARGAVMGAVVVIGDDAVVPVAGFPKLLREVLPPEPLTVVSGPPGSAGIYLATTGQVLADPRPAHDTTSPGASYGKVYGWMSNGLPFSASTYSSGLLGATETVGTGFTAGPSIAGGAAGQGRIVLNESTASPAAQGALRVFAASTAGTDSLLNLLSATVLSRAPLGPPVVTDSVFLSGSTAGAAYFFSPVSPAAVDTFVLVPRGTGNVSACRLALPGQFAIAGDDGTVTIVNHFQSGSTSVVASRNFGKRLAGPPVAAPFPSGAVSRERLVLTTTDGYVYLVDDALQVMPGFPVYSGGPIASPAALADIDQDGKTDIVVFSGRRICVYNGVGADLDHFPLTIHSALPLASSPVVADVDGDGLVDIVGVSEDGQVIAYNRNGDMGRGFPLQAGAGTGACGVFASGDSVFLSVASPEAGTVSLWRTVVAASMPRLPWPQYQMDAAHSGLTLTVPAGTPLSSQFFPRERAYNWPNPVYDGKTYLRYFVGSDATVRITVFDLAGDLVAEFSGPGVGGVDNQVQWDVSGIQSGVYFARIEASGAGESGVAVVKVAVVK